MLPPTGKTWMEPRPWIIVQRFYEKRKYRVKQSTFKESNRRTGENIRFVTTTGNFTSELGV